MSLREASRRDWGSDASRSGTVILAEDIRTGALLRIADAVEKMAERHTELIRQRDYYENEVKRLRTKREHLERSNASLRGHLSLKKKVIKELRKGKP